MIRLSQNLFSSASLNKFAAFSLEECGNEKVNFVIASILEASILSILIQYYSVKQIREPKTLVEKFYQIFLHSLIKNYCHAIALF
ncbi:hypothetical protein [Nodularia sp. UHCC 0506]|uniref:hypothetical protein n=1 Tax=Nodularia sp. UHCC 0506 TaxID=3110243 RepID=UPI002B1FE402|nr:hypothetical protein [Nodularia sp. UHCC 0506]MEA5515698.1 hypothetical protein [Nodularia sp. UHCC 0506]